MRPPVTTRRDSGGQRLGERLHMGGFLLLFFLLVTACEDRFAINRGVDLGYLPNLECVRRVLDDSNDLTGVEYRNLSAASGKGTPRSKLVFSARCVAGNAPKAIFVHLDIRVEEGGRVDIGLQWTGINGKPTGKEVNQILYVMKSIERDLESECHIEGFSSLVKQRCYKVACPPVE
jgi:hypothetical protein